MCHYLGIDLGTSSIKVTIVNQHGKVLVDGIHSYGIIEKNNGWIEQNPQEWLQGLRSVLHEIATKDRSLLEKIISVSVTGQMHGIVPVDDNGSSLHHAIIWSDQRNEKELEQLHALLTNEQWVNMTGNRPNISFTIGKIMWFKKHYPKLYDRVYKFLLPKDYIRMHLTGTFATDYSDASATLLMDVQQKSWSEKIIHLTKLDAQKLPEIKGSTDVVGSVTNYATQTYGLKEGTTVICGCGDALAQALGNGGVHSNDWLCTIGTSGQIIASTEDLKIEQKGSVHTLAHAVPDQWVTMGATLSAGRSFQWFVEAFYEKNQDLETILDAAKNINPASNQLLFLPYLYGERSPYMDEKAKGTFIGLTHEHTNSHAVRAVVEGVLFSLFQSLNIIKQTTALTPEHMILTGGAASHDFWAQTAATIFNVPIVRKANRGGGAYGAAMLAAVGVTDFKDLEEVVDAWDLTEHENILYPNESQSMHYEKKYSIYGKSYDALKEIFHDLHELGHHSKSFK